VTDFLSLFKLAFHLDFCARFIFLFQKIMEKTGAEETGHSGSLTLYNQSVSSYLQEKETGKKKPPPTRAPTLLLV
jgi:hypothetical protein